MTKIFWLKIVSLTRKTKLARWWLALWVLVSLGGGWFSVRAQSRIEFNEVDVNYTFGDKVIFQTRLIPPEGVSDVYIFIQPLGEPTRLEKVSFTEQGEVIFPYDVRVHPLRPFVRTEYWFRAEFQNGDKAESKKLSFDYIDNRQPWQTMDDGGIQVNWLQGDLFFGQSALNTARSAAKTVSTLLPGQTLANGVRVYIYSSAAQLRDAMNQAPSAWAVGEASPDLGVVLVSVSPGTEQQLDMDRQIPHELMHVLVYQIAKDSYANIPLWLNEGLATLAETYSNPDYQRALKKAVKDGTLFPMADLCGGFPNDASGAFLGYAESASFIRFMQNKFSNRGLMDLVNAYRNSYSCEDGVQAVTGSSLGQLDYRWRQEMLGVDTGVLAIQNLSPYLAVIAILLVVPFLVAGFTHRRSH